MKIVGVIPARWGSTRFEGKVLATIAGKPMIQHVWERSLKSRKLHDLIIACDDKRVFSIVEGFGAKCVMTSPKHQSGSDRIAEVVKDLDVDIIINVQGDEPLIHHSVIDDLADCLVEDKSADMATVIKFFGKGEDVTNPNVVKVVIDENQYALYFSRSVIPFNREGKSSVSYCKHLGIYAYRKDFLLKFKNLPQSHLEKVEQLEQLRALEAGYKIKTVLTEIQTAGVDVPSDIKRVEALMK